MFLKSRLRQGVNIKRCIAVSLFLCFLVACRGESAPTPDLDALRAQVKQEVLAELTDKAPTATQTPTATRWPTNTPAPTRTSQATPGDAQPPAQTVMPSPTATSETAGKAAAETSPGTSTSRPPTLTPTKSPVPAKTVPATSTEASASPKVKPARPSPTPTAPPPSALAGTIAFAAYEPALGGYTLYAYTGGALQAIAHDVHQPDIRPDGLEIAVDGAGAGKEDLWAMDMGGGNWRQLSHHPDDHYPNWSADGFQVAFSSTRQGDGVYRLYLGDTSMVTYRTPFIIGDYPILLWSGDVVFAGCDYGWGSDSRCGVWYTSQGGLPTWLTDRPHDVPTDANPSDVLFLREEGGNWDIYRVGTGGGEPVRLTDNAGRDGPAALSPDGKRVAFLSDRSGGWALYSSDLLGGQVRKVVELPPGAGYDQAPYPWWSERIAWGSGPAAPTPAPTPVGRPLLPAPLISFPIQEDTVSSTKSTIITWSWDRALGANQGFEVRFWHESESTPAGVAAPVTVTELEVWLGLTGAYRWHGEGNYYLDVVVVEVDPYRVVSEGVRVLVKTDPGK